MGIKANAASTTSQLPPKRSMQIAVGLLAGAAFINYVDRGNLSMAAPLLKTDLGLSPSTLGILLSSFFWSYTLLNFFSGWVVDRFDAGIVLAVGYLIWSLATAATGLVQGLATLILMRLLLGVGESITFPACSKIIGSQLPECRRGTANGLLMAGIRCGTAAGALGAGLLMAVYGWRPVFVGIGLISLLWLPAWLRWMPQLRTRPESAPMRPVVEILRQPAFWGATAGQFSGTYFLYFMVTWLPLYLVHERGLSGAAMARTAALYYLVDASSSFLSGWFADFSIRHGGEVTFVRKSAMAIGWSIGAIGLVGCAMASSRSYVGWLLIAGVGCGTGGYGVLLFAQSLAGPQDVGRWCGLQNGIGNLSGVLAPAITGWTVDKTGNFRLALLIAAGFSALSVIAWLFGIGELKEVDWDRSIRKHVSGGALVGTTGHTKQILTGESTWQQAAKH